MRFPLFTFALCLSMIAKAQDSCLIQLMVAPMEQEESIPKNVIDMLEDRLIYAINSVDNMSASKDYGQFFISGKIVNIENELLDTKIVARTTVMLYMGDVKRKSIMSSESFELSGIANSEGSALLSSIYNSKTDRKFRTFVTTGREKIIEYFDKNYKQYIDSAFIAEAKGCYEEALYYLTMIPSKCIGYAEAKKASDRIIRKCDTQKSAATIGKEWNRKQQRLRPTIDFIKYK